VVAISEKIRRRWEREGERRETEELELLAALLIPLFGCSRGSYRS
jgi:hypothetical protein